MSTKLYDAFVTNVARRMKTLGLTRAELAKRLKVTPSWITQILGGHRRPGLHTLDAFAVALNTDADKLIRICRKRDPGKTPVSA